VPKTALDVVRLRDPRWLDAPDTRGSRWIAGDPCVYCGDPASTWDHLEPQVKGHRNQDNLARACYACNEAKGPVGLIQFLAWRSKQRRALATRPAFPYAEYPSIEEMRQGTRRWRKAIKNKLRAPDLDPTTRADAESILEDLTALQRAIEPEYVKVDRAAGAPWVKGAPA
jgi:hypothetical protein